MAVLTWVEFHEKLIGYTITSYMTGKGQFKFVLYNTYKNEPKELELIADKMHPAYIFERNEEYFRFMNTYSDTASEE